MHDAKKFREFAEECRRLALRASAKDKSVLLEIADAWMECAEQAERIQRKEDEMQTRRASS
jgi:hypothetical protein